MDITTKLIHGDILNRDSYNSLRFPIYDSVAFEFGSANEMENAFLGRSPSYFYSRISNPTVSELERIITVATDAYGAIALSSGMAAIANTLMSIGGKSANFITSSYLFGNTYSLFDKTFRRFGLVPKYVDLFDIEKVQESIDENTIAIFFEVITNPQLVVFDVEGIVNVAKRNNLITIADTTIPTFYLFSSKKWNVDIEVISTTKAISGGATSVGGVIIDYGTYDWSKNKFLREDYEKYGKGAFLMKLKKEVYRNIGACMSPHNAYLNILGLETLPLRVKTSSTNALAISKELSNHKKIKSVNYPGLETSKFYRNAQKFLNGYYGSIFTIELESKELAFKFINNLKLCRRATNIYDNKTLVIHPSSTIFCEYSSDKKLELGVTEGMVRFSVGIEKPEDIYEDIIKALEVL